MRPLIVHASSKSHAQNPRRVLHIEYAASESIALYRGRLAPSPTGLLHLGHARTLWVAAQRAVERSGQLVLRNEDLDPQRCGAEFVAAMIEDLHWLRIKWVEGPDCGGPFGPYAQSKRRGFYLEAWKRLREQGLIYPCTCSRKDVAQAASAPNDGDDEPVYSGRCRPRSEQRGCGPPDGRGRPSPQGQETRAG